MVKSIIVNLLVLSYANALTLRNNWDDDMAEKNFDDDTVDEVHDYTPETMLS